MDYLLDTKAAHVIIAYFDHWPCSYHHDFVCPVHAGLFMSDYCIHLLDTARTPPLDIGAHAAEEGMVPKAGISVEVADRRLVNRPASGSRHFASEPAVNTGLSGDCFFVLLFALINPWLEEMYWRGALLEAESGWPVWLNVLYSTLLFVMSHPLMWGVFSIGNRSPHLYLSLFLMEVVWAAIRYRTKSLRWPIYSHILVDIGNLSVFVFLNIYIPPGMS